jgi:hypothetical protein
MKVYAIVESRATDKQLLEKTIQENVKALQERYGDLIKIISIAEPKKEGIWYVSFVEIFYEPKNLMDLFKFVAVESPAYLELEGEDLELPREQLSEYISLLSNIYYKLRKLLNLHTVSYTEESNSRWISPELAEDLVITHQDVLLVSFISEINVIEPKDEYIKPIFTTLSDFLPFEYEILHESKDSNGYILAVRVQGIAKRISTLFYLISSFCPLRIEIVEPEKVKVPISELQEGLNIFSSLMASVKAVVELKLSSKFGNKGQVQ